MFAAEIYRRISEDLKLPSKNGITSRNGESKYRAKLRLKQVSHFTITFTAIKPLKSQKMVWLKMSRHR